MKPTLAAPSAPTSTAPLVAIFESGWVGDRRVITVDAMGTARHGAAVDTKPWAWIPFSAPVDAVIYVRQLAPGRLFCGRTREATVECVVDGVPATAGQAEVRRFVLPFEGAVRQLGAYTSSDGSGFVDAVVCGTTDRGSACWGFPQDGGVANVMSPPASLAQEAAAGVAADTLVPWQALESEFRTAMIRKVVRSDVRNPSRLVPVASKGARSRDISAQCALLQGGELRCYGPGAYGQLGDGNVAVGPRASRPFGDAVVVDVAMRGHAGCAVLADGRVACWGELPSLPVPRQHKTTRIGACKLDRARSSAAFTAARAADLEGVKQCIAGCRTSPPGMRDACLGCVPHCVAIPYLFAQAPVCQVPAYELLLPQQERTCADEDTPPSWLSDAELRDLVTPIEVTRSPVVLPGITDAIAVVLPLSPALCVVRKGGALACLDDRNRLVPVAAP